MTFTEDTLITVVSQIVLTATTIATLRTKLTDLERRVKAAEECISTLHTDFVPRLEMNTILGGIHRELSDIAGNVRLAIGHRLNHRNAPDGEGKN